MEQKVKSIEADGRKFLERLGYKEENGFTATKCLCFADVSHLYAQNLDLIINNGPEI